MLVTITGSPINSERFVWEHIFKAVPPLPLPLFPLFNLCDSACLPLHVGAGLPEFARGRGGLHLGAGCQ